MGKIRTSPLAPFPTAESTKKCPFFLLKRFVSNDPDQPDSSMFSLKGRRKSLDESLKDRSDTAKCVFIVVVTFLTGMVCGTHISCRSTKSSVRNSSVGSIHRLADTPIRNTSHKDAYDRPITKQQLIEPFYVPNVAGFSVATLQPDQRIDAHEHQSMHEFFYILEGKVTFTIDGKKTLVEEGTMVHITPHEVHQLDAWKDGPAKMLVSGITVDDQ